MRSVKLGVLAGVVCASMAAAQTFGTWTPEARRVNPDYTPNAAGALVMGRNRDGKCFNFSVLRENGTRRVIPMADPTALVIPDASGTPWVYVTGTSDWARTANFCIYKSKDLVHWEPHATAFRESYRLERFNEPGPFLADPKDTLLIQPDNIRPGGDVLRLSPVQGTSIQLVDMWAPQLYIDPVFPNRVTLAFTAKVLSQSPASPWTTPTSPTTPTVYTVQVPIEQFLKGYLDTSKVYFGDLPLSPLSTYVYNSDNSSWWDGGAHIGQAVPVSAYGRYTDPAGAPGTLTFFDNAGTSNDYYSHIGINNPRSVMAIDNFVYFETNNRPWMLYTYWTPAMNVAAHPMINVVTTEWWFRQRCMDPAGATPALIDLAYPRNQNNRPDALEGSSSCFPTTAGTVDNGACGDVCEGPAAFRRTTTGANPTTYTYVLFSRNGTLSPAYGIFYRKTTGSLHDLRLVNNPQPWEGAVVTSARRTLDGGVSFGHGEVFPFNQRHYLIFHVKETADENGEFPLTRFGARTVYFKELTFDEATGDILPLSCDQTDPTLDVNVFLAPYLSTTWTYMAAPPGGEN